MKKKTLMRGLAGMLAAGMLCLMPVTSYVNAAEQGYVQTTERSAEFYGVNAETQDLDITTNETDSLETADTGKHASGGSDADKSAESEPDKMPQESERTNHADEIPDENVQDGHADINEKDAMSVDATGKMASESDETGKVESESDVAEKMTSESDETGKEESESDVSEEMESEPDTEKESEETLPDFYEYWQDGPMRRLGMSGMRRAGNPTVKRDESLILHYLDFPCYFKYVTNHGMSTGGKTVAAYCVYNTREAPENETYKPSGDGPFSKEITYCLYNGCRYRGSTAYNSRYSAGDWKKDYYITQIAVHIINCQQGRETSIEKKLKKSMDTKVYNLAYKMVEDAYADTTQVSADNNQTMEVTCSISPTTQDTWVQQADGTWRTQAEFVCTSNLPDRIIDAALMPEGTLPDGVSIAKKEEGDLLSPFWFTATDEAYRKLSRERTEIKATLEVSCEEYGGWWYVPVNSSVKRQYVTYLSMDETTMVHPEARTVTASAYTPYFGVSLRKKDARDQAGVADAVYGLYADEACSMLVAQFPKTGSDGTAELEDLELTQDVYYVKERSCGLLCG